MKRYRYFFISNYMYNSNSVRLVRWWSAPLIRMGSFVRGQCFVTAESEPEARKIAKEEFENSGFKEKFMGRYI